RRNHFISFISLISMLGIALGVTTLITVISVMNGFEKELRARILGAIAHATIQPVEGALAEWREVVERVQQHPEVDGAAPYIEEGVWLQGQESSGAFIRGIDPDYEIHVSEIEDKMLSGSLADLVPGEYGIVLGIGLASRLRVGPGDRVTVIAPRLKATPVGASPLMRRFTVVGAFEFGEFENDSALALIHMEDAARLLRMPPGTAGGVRLHLADLYRAWSVARDISEDMTQEGWGQPGGADTPAYYVVRDWTQERGNLFQAVRTEKTVMWVILSLIIAVAAFNIISMLVMVVTDKQSDIAILKTMGARPGTIMRVFVIQGSVIGVVGTVLGVIGGILLAHNIGAVVPFLERLFGFSLFPSDIYYITELPSDLRTADVVKFALMSLGMSLLSTIYPSWRAARTHPAEALSYE
ncbi:MAG: lipoprotein-releasing ABC transporter permease subunit, partial [Xanthomonadales bacterium]|nr:lipoprotein-releasing ABC transporter permease subunit [Xanthomonadales bacterium]